MRGVGYPIVCVIGRLGCDWITRENAEKKSHYDDATVFTA